MIIFFGTTVYHNCLTYNKDNNCVTLGLSNSNKRYLKQQLSGKNGIFRKYCMVRRKNYCIRSVISPNINIPIDTILLPEKAYSNLHNTGDNIKYKNNDIAFKSLLSSNSLTIQINPVIATNFGVDFDGDEMNNRIESNLSPRRSLRLLIYLFILKEELIVATTTSTATIITNKEICIYKTFN
ncbi:beta and beta-prime subunits of DNA dependent RNA-polymerase [Anaeromyces robustus]|uniref:DNA-directed RNA polymerase n=1 Tax=Anaeromyces robustus TaxID=1754192 RepID=A0A1Y1XJA5_9FUNG|nr:beta and beta-prime subunits of DNA dependent RNA-polymerase [Anaeromyces robustus]|eukprot:ORX85828.1 beta and beta-prime subunits of DNA dependent RNA-polymerase [Anaeromyces robustus]